MGRTLRYALTVSIGATAAVVLAAASIAGLPKGAGPLDEQKRASLYPNPVFPAAPVWEYASLATADFDHDGFQDVVIANEWGGVSVLLGAGDGSFAPATSHGSSSEPGHVLTHDFNGDGNVDVAVTDWRNYDTVYVFLGNGDGTFGDPSHYGTGGGAASLGIGDLNGDGQADLAVANSWEDDIEILLGQGDGTFMTDSRIPVGDFPDSIAVADVDADGRLDLLIAVDGSAIGVLRGRGDASFNATVTFAAGFPISALAVADVDGDDHADIVGLVAYLGSLAGPGFGVLRGNGDGTFGPATIQGWQTGNPGGIQGLAVHDVDGDGHIDVVMPAWGDQLYSGVAIAFGNGDGTFGAQEIHGGAGGVAAVGFADFDGDGRTDIAAADAMVEGATILSNHGGRSLGDRPPAYAAGVSPISALIADFDADGRPDVAAIDRVSANASILMGSGDGRLLPERRFPTGGLPGLGAVVADDFDGDGRVDLAVGLRQSGNVSILRGSGDGTFEPPLSFPFGVGTSYLISADLNHDGDPDLATSNSTTGTMSILVGAPGAAFGAPIPHPVPSAGALAASDFDADGHPDLAVAGRASQSSALWLLKGTGNGTFSASVAGTFPEAISGLAAGDLDGDDRSDLALVEGSTAGWLRGRGDGTFEAPVVVAGQSSGPSVHVADADADGFPDIVTAGSWITIVPGNGDGTFAEPHLFLGARAFSAGLGDLDLDGGLDIVLPTQNNEVLVLLNRHPPDADRDGIADRGDNCPTIPNPDQDPEACHQSVEDVAISVNRPSGRGAGTVSWNTTHEVTLEGFNVVTFDERGERVQINDGLIPCESCSTGQGGSYSFFLPKHRGGRNVFVETVCTTECGGPWGPAVMVRSEPSSGGPSRRRL